MAYSTNNGTAIDVTNLGAIPNGAIDVTSIIQGGINSLYPNGGGTLFFPKGNYLTSGYLNITGNNITLLGEPGSIITTIPSGDFRKFNISGTSGVVLQNLIINAGRTSGINGQYVGTINVYNSQYFTLNNCYVGNSEGLLVHLRGNTIYPTIEHNTFENYQVGIFCDNNDVKDTSPQKIKITDNVFNNSWGTNNQANFGAIKLQSIAPWTGAATGRCEGNIISRNTIYSGSQMGIELWGAVQNSIVSDNYIRNATFGISIAGSSWDIAVSNNIIKETTYCGIEIAQVSGVSVVGNVIDGGTGALIRDGIIVNSAIDINVVGNIVKNVNHSAFYTYPSAGNPKRVNFNGNTAIQALTNTVGGAGFYFQGGEQIRFTNNNINFTPSGGYFGFIDNAGTNVSGLVISNNSFNGSADQWGILFYSGVGTTGYSTNVLLENNSLAGIDFVRYTFNGIVGIQSQLPYGIFRNNFSSSGSIYTIPDQTFPAGSTPYGNSNIQGAYQYYGSSSFTVPSGGITGGAWICVFSGGAGNMNTIRTRLYNDGSLADPRSIELTMVGVPYSSNSQHSLTINPYSQWWNTFYKGFRTSSNSDTARMSLWVNITGFPSGKAGSQFTIYNSEINYSTGYFTYTEPIWAFDSAYINIQNPPVNTETFLKLSNGVAIGNNTFVYSPSSGVLSFNANSILGITGTSQWSNVGAGISYVGGNVGINHTNPQYSLDISGIAQATGLRIKGGSYDLQSVTISGNYSILGSESRIYCNSSLPMTITFPSAITYSGYLTKIKILNTGPITLTGTFGQIFDTGAYYYLSGYNYAAEVHSNGQNWYLW